MADAGNVIGLTFGQLFLWALVFPLLFIGGAALGSISRTTPVALLNTLGMASFLTMALWAKGHRLDGSHGFWFGVFGAFLVPMLIGLPWGIASRAKGEAADRRSSPEARRAD